MRRARSYAKATFYDNPKAYSLEAAVRAYQTFLREVPDAPQVPQVRERLAQLALASHLPEEEQKETK